MSSRHHIDDFIRGRIIGKIEKGRKITDVAREFDIAHIVVSRLWKSFKTTGMYSRRHGEVVLEVRRLQKTDISSYQQKGTGAPQISRWKISFLLPQESRSPEKLLPDHRTARLQWCREHHNWNEQDWACVQFTDESRFSPSSDCRRQLIWHESGTAYRPENIQEKDRYPTCSIMVWAGIIISGRTRLHVVANGTMTSQRYIDEVLLSHVRLFRGAVGDKFVFMDDNATCHRTLAVQDCLDSEGIQRLVWPARSPDLNPIENVWDALGRQVAGRNYPPTNKNILIRALTEEWDKLPQQLLDNVVQSVAVCPKSKTTDGFELQFGVNHLGHFLLTNLLLDKIKASAPARIVNVASAAHLIGDINFGDINMEKNYSALMAYCNSKLANLLFTRELAKKLKGSGVSTYSLHPGSVHTELSRNLSSVNQIIGSIYDFVMKLTFKSARKGASTTIYCAVEESLASESGLYYTFIPIEVSKFQNSNIDTTLQSVATAQS
ncbi:hypothetical protein TNCV_4529701 [Trichonephila clavipes]|nr:hypothetical protein TNCV_4529701 [Trichonephila clavipes]